MSSEIWKPIKDYEGLYEVSSLGRIKSMPKKFIRNGAVTHFEEKILTPSDSHGYRSVVLTKNGIHKTHSVHRLVALAFIQNPNNYTQINHKDENKSNNRVENLE
ncbi:NUMOD4 domain-containing protein [Phocaeicola coprocola]